MYRKCSIPLQLFIASAILAGCTSAPNREVRFDQESGLTWASMDEAIVLARSAPQYTVAARDYIYIGPVETNQLGERQHYLWLGTASTVDRELRGNSAPDTETLLLMIDGTPVAFALSIWQAEFQTTPYDAQVPIADSWGARVSLDQIRQIAQADSVEVHLVSEAGVTARYELWHGDWLNWVEFSERVGEGLEARALAR